MYGRLTGRVCCCNGRRAADVRRTHTTIRQAANTLCPRIRLRCGVRFRRAPGHRYVNTCVRSDIVATTAVVGVANPVSVVDADVVDDNLERIAANPAASDTPAFDIDTIPPASLTPDQLDSRRLSNLTASTSSQSTYYASTRPRPTSPASSPSETPLSPAFSRPTVVPSDLPWQSPIPRSPPAAPSPPAFPGSIQRPTAPSVGPSNRLTPPQPSLELPPAAAELYAGTSIATNLSSTAGSSDVLAPLLDALQLESAVQAGPPGASSDAQRVYKAGSTTDSASGSAAADSGSSTAALLQRKRKRLQVLDASELLMARDEAVRTELLGRTWKDLLRFDERLAPGAAGQPTGRPEAAAAGASSLSTQAAQPQGLQQHSGQEPQDAEEVSSLEDLLAVMQQATSDLREQQQEQQQQEMQGQQQAQQDVSDFDATRRVAAMLGKSPESRLMDVLREASSWRQLQTLYLDLRAAFGAPHLAVLLFRLARFLHGAARVGMPRQERVTLYQLFEAVLAQAIFTAPDMGGAQAVSVVRSVSYVPFRFGPDVKATLDTLQRFLRYSTLGATPGGKAGQGLDGTGGGDGDGAILNASKVAVARRGGGARAQAAAAAALGEPGQGPPVGGSPGWPGPVPVPQSAVEGQPVAPLSRQQQNIGTSEAERAPTSVHGTGPSSTTATGASSSKAAAVPDAAPTRVGGLHGPLRGPHYAILAYSLGRINARARPFRMSLRLPGSIKHGLLRGSYATLPSLRPRDFPRLLFGLALLRISPPGPWLYAFYLTSARALPAMSDVDLTMLIYSACRLTGKPPAPWLEAYLGTLRQRLQHLDTGGLAIVLHALGRLKYKPRPEWLAAYLTAVQAVLATDGGFQLSELSLLVRGMMFLRLGDQLEEREGLLKDFLQCSGTAMAAGQVSVAQAANLAWALGQMQVTPPSSWQDVLLYLTRAKTPLLRPYHRRRLLAALHAFGRRDLQAWYELLRIPLREMPGYAVMKAREAARRVREAKAQLAKEKRQKEREAKRLEHLARIAERRRAKRRLYKRWWWKVRPPKKLALRLAAMKEREQKLAAVTARAAAAGLRVGDVGNAAGGQPSKDGSPDGRGATGKVSGP